MKQILITHGAAKQLLKVYCYIFNKSYIKRLMTIIFYYDEYMTEELLRSFACSYLCNTET